MKQFGTPDLLTRLRAIGAEIEALGANTHLTNLSSLVHDAAFAMQQLQEHGDYFWPVLRHGIADGDEHEYSNCSVCNMPVMYGERHHSCGSAIIKIERERDKAKEALNDFYGLNERLAILLCRIANALKGDPPANESHDHSDLPEVAGKIAADCNELREFAQHVVKELPYLSIGVLATYHGLLRHTREGIEHTPLLTGKPDKTVAQDK